MKHFRGLTLAAISLLAAVSYAEDVVAPDVASDVKVLQTDTFDSFMNEHPLVLAECKFYLLLPSFFFGFIMPKRRLLLVLTGNFGCSLCALVWSLQGTCS